MCVYIMPEPMSFDFICNTQNSIAPESKSQLHLPPKISQVGKLLKSHLQRVDPAELKIIPDVTLSFQDSEWDSDDSGLEDLVRQA